MITNNTYEHLALEVLATFEHSGGTVAFYCVDFIQFYTFSVMHMMSLINFSIRLGLYDAEVTQTPAYDALFISRLTRESQEDAWKKLSINPAYDPHWSKATILQSPALRYIHFILSHTLIGSGDSIGIVS